MRRSTMYMLLLMFITVLTIVLKGYALEKLWSWFLVPWLTPSAPSLILCLGIATIITLLVQGPSAERKVKSRGEEAESVSLSLDIDSLPVNSLAKKKIKALRKLADRNVSYEIKDAIWATITSPLLCLAFGWILKHFL